MVEMRNMKQFRFMRERFYRQFEHFWPNIYETEYALFDIFPITQEVVDEIREATSNVGRIFYKTAHLLRNADDETLLALGIPVETIGTIRLKPIKPESVIARMDFVETNQGLKLLEINSDTPTFIVECFQMNGEVAKEFGYRDPNKDTETFLKRAMEKAIMESAEWLQSNELPNLVFSAHDDHIEDWNTVRYLKELIDFPAKLVPLQHLRIDSNGLYDDEGTQIDILYRQTYPLEHLIHDQADDGTKVGIQLLDLVKKKKLALLNPTSAFLIQSKAVQAAIWSLYEQNQYFGERERGWIEQYFLPTYLEPEPFLQAKQKFVKKPSFGREGDTVQVFDPKGEVVLQSENKTYEDELPIYQEYVELPKTEVHTEEGMKSVHYIIGSFLIAGQPSAIGVRAGKQITGNESYFLPIGLDEKNV